MINGEDMKAIRLGLASPERIRSWSSGEVLIPETINFRTGKPEPDGLFCERIFGPDRDWCCACGRYKHTRLPGKICERCGVELTESRVRRERMGHIELAAPIAHPWFARSTPNIIGQLLALTPSQVAALLSYTDYLVLNVDGEVLAETVALTMNAERSTAPVAPHTGQEEREQSFGKREGMGQSFPASLESVLSELVPGQILPYESVSLLNCWCPSVCRVATGAEAVRQALEALDLTTLSQSLRRALNDCEEQSERAALVRRLRVIEAFCLSRQNPAWMVMTVLPVLPPELRPVVPVGGDRYATSDVNALYCRVLARNKRIRRLQEMHAPDLILNNEKRLLQQSCDALLDNARLKRPITDSRRHPLKSLTDTIRGKEGRFRRNMLGKRVDYSGRSVISAGLDLRLHECGLPKKIALELFKPFVIRKLVEGAYAQTARQAKRMVERGKKAPPIVWDMLAECMHQKMVLLNRAPTLHRLSIQAFEAVLVEGNAILLHPLVCSAFNADFDGDQMAVHLPLSELAQQEARSLLLSTRNLRSPATGEPTISISQDMVLGCFYLTQQRPNTNGKHLTFSSPTEALLALEHGIITLQSAITVRLSHSDVLDVPPVLPRTPARTHTRVQTTAGRLLFNQALPVQLGFRNYEMTKERLKQLLIECLSSEPTDLVAEVADTLKRLGFHYATVSGTSIALRDIAIPPEREDILVKADARIEELHMQEQQGLITQQERYEQSIHVWSEATEELTCHLERRLDPYGNLATIARSGATKAKMQQIRQLAGMRGLMASPSGSIIEIPIRSNYKLGLTVAEYIIGSHGARKGTMDRSLNTKNSGYRTIILVEVGQPVTVTAQDCGDSEGILITHRDSQALGLPDMRTRILSRALAESITLSNGTVFAAGTLLNEEVVSRLLLSGTDAVRVRSPLTCKQPRGVCALCYGFDLSTWSLVRQGTAVGIIAAQSIGEPGTQLTMRTFHAGGIANASGDITAGIPRVNELFEAHPPKTPAILTTQSGMVEIGTKDEHGGVMVSVVETETTVDEYPTAPLHETPVHLCVQEGDRVQVGTLLWREGDGPGGNEIRSRTTGIVTGVASSHLCISHEQRVSSTYSIPPGRTLLVSQGTPVEAGMPLSTGTSNPHELLDIAGCMATAHYLIREIQRVYRTTGVYLHDKHVEVIVQQMLRRVHVTESGDTRYLPGDLIDRFAFTATNAALLAQGGTPARARPVLLGTIRTALTNESWLAAAAFQHTSRILTDAAISARPDNLVGFKESILVGKRLPIASPPQR